MEKERKDWIAYTALTISIISILLSSWNFYMTWYVLPRAELSIISTNFTYQPGIVTDEFENLKVNIEGIIINEGQRTTSLKDREFLYVFSGDEGDDVRISSKRSIMQSTEVASKILPQKESTNFTFIATVSFEFIESVGGKPGEFSEFILTIFHDDGIGRLSNSERIIW